MARDWEIHHVCFPVSSWDQTCPAGGQSWNKHFFINPENLWKRIWPKKRVNYNQIEIAVKLNLTKMHNFSLFLTGATLPSYVNSIHIICWLWKWYFPSYFLFECPKIKLWRKTKPIWWKICGVSSAHFCQLCRRAVVITQMK